ncbi:MAG: hypothetical protein H8E32_12725 [Nitrospinae bacterium]|nr:hypothetical protein [Nitrospinota bacterium]
MKQQIPWIIVFSLLLSSCSGDSLKRFFYGLNQSQQQEACRKDPTINCPEKESYDQYQKKREELSKE